jgi:tetratricopeptide (TPR) repeat protein
MDSAIALFTEITIKTSSDNANDALDRISNIEQFKKYNKAFDLFVKAELKNEQRKYPEAVQLYIESADAGANTELSEKAFIIASELEAKMNHTDKARELLLKILAQNPETYNGDYILYNLGQFYNIEGNKTEALNKFNELLAKYPRSIYLNQARELIRQIRPKVN